MKKERKIDTRKSVIKKAAKSGSQGIEKQVTKNRERGITLIALVVTIIIMLILAAVTLNMALGDNGLIQMAKFAANKYEQAAINESLAMQGLVNDLNNPESVEPTTTTTPTPSTATPTESGGEEKEDESTIQIGDVVNYTPDKKNSGYIIKKEYSGYSEDQTINQITYQWKVMDIDDNGTVKIIGIIQNEYPYLTLSGPPGYNNGVYLLNDACEKLYSNKQLGVTARSINMDDFESHLTEKGRELRNNYTTDTADQYKYGDWGTFSDASFPVLAKFEDHIKVNNGNMGELSVSESGYGSCSVPIAENDLKAYTTSQSSGTLQVQNTGHNSGAQWSWGCYDDAFYAVALGPTYYHAIWIASRFSVCANDHVNFGLTRLSDREFDDRPLWNSRPPDRIPQYHEEINMIAPVVTLGLDILYEKSDDGSWNISKKEI